jgi:thiol-disulfide isomerase/thioredoxin
MMNALLVALSLFATEGRSPIATFNLKSIDGKPVRSADLAGKVTVLSFWATWCGPCKQELKVLERMQKDNPGLNIIAVATDGPETAATVRSTVKQQKWSFTVVTDPEGALSAVLNPRGNVPFALFIDKQGKVAHTHAGFVAGDEAQYGPLISQLLAETAP